MKLIYSVLLGLFSTLLVSLYFLDDSLVGARNDYFKISLFLLGSFYFIKNKNKSISDGIFYFSGGVVLLYLSYSSITHFPTNDFFNRNFMRGIHYFLLFGYIYFYRTTFYQRYLVLGSYLIIIHSIFFLLNEARAIYLFPFLFIGLLYPLSPSGKFQKRNVLLPNSVFLYFLFIFLVYWKTNPTLIYEYLAFGLLATIPLVILTFNQISIYNKKRLFFILMLLLFFQGLSLNAYIIHQFIENYGKPDFSLRILELPISSLGALSLIGILLSLGVILQSKSKNLIFYLSIGNFILYSSLLYISHSRTSMISVILGVVIAFMLLARKHHRIIKLESIYMKLILFLLVVVGFFIFYNKSVSINTLEVRFAIWDYHTKHAIQNSLFWGNGFSPEWKIFYSIPIGLMSTTEEYIRSYISSFHSYPHAHNLYVQIFSSFGLVGCFVLIAYLISLYYKILINKDIDLKSFKFTFIFLSLAFLFHEITDYHALEYPVLFPLLLLISFSIKKTKSQGVFNNRIAASLIYGAISIFICIIILHTKMIEIYKKDLSVYYSFDVLEFSNILDDPKEPMVSWSYPKLDFTTQILNERNASLFKALYKESIYERNRSKKLSQEIESIYTQCIQSNPKDLYCQVKLDILNNKFE